MSRDVVPLPTRYHGWGFDVSVPKDCRVEKETMVDFDMYRIARGDEQLLFIYAGYHPSFPKNVPKTMKIRQTRIHGKFTQYASWKEANLYFEHVLIRLHSFEKLLRTNDGRPAFLHCIYTGLDDEDAKLSDAIIRSIQATETE